jgi:hypothetical protein
MTVILVLLVAIASSFVTHVLTSRSVWKMARAEIAHWRSQACIVSDLLESERSDGRKMLAHVLELKRDGFRAPRPDEVGEASVYSLDDVDEERMLTREPSDFTSWPP